LYDGRANWLEKMRRSPKFDQKKGVRRLARERVGPAPPSRAIEPKDLRKKPKHKKLIVDVDPQQE
jgi:hypothetical protein